MNKHNLNVFEKEYALMSNRNGSVDPADYFQKLLKIRCDYIHKYGNGKNIFEIGCGNGKTLFSFARLIRTGLGADFSKIAISQAKSEAAIKKVPNLRFIELDITKDHLPQRRFDLIYSFSTLYYISDLKSTLFKIHRLLKNGGVAILDLGNKNSLNSLVGHYYPELARMNNYTIKQTLQVLESLNFTIESWRSFQLLPLWGNRPIWLRPLLHPAWKAIAQTEIGGKMLDEYISSLPIIRLLAFRHIVVCEKT